MARENFKVIEKKTGKEYWVSRSIAVVACLVAYNPETREYNFLVEKRGKGCPDFVGALAFPCGYLGWDETRKEAVIREVFEELGLQIAPDTVSEWVTVDDPKQNHQNVVTRYLIPVDYDTISEWIKNGPDLNTQDRGGEPDEVEEVKLIPYSEVVKEPNWAFGHNEVIEEIISMINEYIDDTVIPEEEEVKDAGKSNENNNEFESGAATAGEDMYD